MPGGNYRSVVRRSQRGAIKDLGQSKLKLRKNNKNNGVTTAYIKVGIPVSDFLYGLYPELKLAGAVERFLEDSARNSTVEK